MSTRNHLVFAASWIAAVASHLAASEPQYDYNQELAKRTIAYIIQTEPTEPAQVAIRSTLEALLKKNQRISVRIRQEGDAYSETDYLFDATSGVLSPSKRSTEEEPAITLHLPHFFSKFDVHSSGRKLTLHLNPELNYEQKKEK